MTNMTTIDQVCDRIHEKYEEAKNLEFVNNPIAYALYQTWKEYDSMCRPKLRGKGTEARNDQTRSDGSFPQGS